MKRIFFFLLSAILSCIITMGCSPYAPEVKEPAPQEKAQENLSPQEAEGTPNRLEDGTLGDNKEDTEEDIIGEMMKTMTLEQKIGQVFIVSIRPLYRDGRPILQMNEDVEKMIRDFHPGGIILFAENIDTIDQTRTLIKDIKAVSSIPIFMAIDEEGGSISRINRSGKMHATRLPTKQAIGSIDDTKLAERVGEVIAKEIAALGFNMNFAPVADVNTNPENPVIGDRSFGSHPELVARMVQAELRGMHTHDIVTVLKHFPGHGDTHLDSHYNTVVLEHDRERLEKVEFVPFKKGIEAGTDGIMTAHINVPNITGDNIPSTLSRDILTGILRDEMGFEGIIITDALDMAAISGQYTSKEAALLAFEAGADILLMPQSLEEAFNGLLQAVKEGRISQERLDESVKRILTVKQKGNILDRSEPALDADAVLGCREHQAVADTIRDRAKSRR